MLSAALIQRIDEVAALLGEPRSTVMRMAMRIGLDRFEKTMRDGGALTLSEIGSARASEQQSVIEDRPHTKTDYTESDPKTRPSVMNESPAKTTRAKMIRVDKKGGGE